MTPQDREKAREVVARRNRVFTAAEELLVVLGDEPDLFLSRGSLDGRCMVEITVKTRPFNSSDVVLGIDENGMPVMKPAA